MKKLFTFIVGAVVSLGAYAQDFDSGGLMYSVLSPDDKTCAVTGIGDDVDKYSITSLTIPPTVIYEGEEYTVTEIGADACTRLVNMTELNLPETLKYIGYEAFSNCNSLPSLTIPNSVETIDSWAFEYSYNLHTVVLGESVSQIYHQPFYQAPLVAVKVLGTTPPMLNTNYTEIFPASALIGVAVDSAEVIEDYKEAWPAANIVAYKGAEANSLYFNQNSYSVKAGESIQLEYSVDPEDTPVGFCVRADGVTISNEGLITTSPFVDYDFSTAITAGTLNGLFTTCELIVSALPRFNVDGLVYSVYPGEEKEVILTGVDEIPANLVIPETVEYNGETYTVAYIKDNAIRWIDTLEELTIPATIKSIGNYSFQDCNNLSKVTIADSNEPLEIGQNLFNSCDNLTTFYLGRNIAGNTLEAYYCNLNRVILGTDITEIPEGTFLGYRNNISIVESYNPVPPTLLGNCFSYNRDQIKVIVPDEYVEAYQEAWGEWFPSIGVAKDVTELRFENDEVTIYVGQDVKLPLIVTPEDAAIMWSSSDKSLVNVNSEGYIWVNDWNRSGEVVITATTLNGLSAECRVIVQKWFSIPQSTITLALDETQQLEIEKSERFSALGVPVTWGVGYGDDVVAIDPETGVITAKAYGNARIYAMAYIEEIGSTLYEYADVKVVVYPTSFTTESQEITVYKNSNAYIDLSFEPNDEYVDKTLNWTVENPEIAEVTQSWNGEYFVYGIANGTTTIVGETLNGLKVEITVKVISQIDELIFNTNKIYVAPEGTFQLEYTTVPEETGQSIRFQSENESIATVDPETGLVTGVNYGNTYIIAFAQNGWSWSVPVEVCNLPESVKFVGSSDYEGNVDQWTWFNIEYTPDNDDICKEIQWTIDDPELGYFDSHANAFYGQKIGTAAIKGVAVNGDVLEGTITIGGIVILVNGENSRWNEVNLGTELKLGIQASSDELRNNVTFRSNNPEVVTVTEDGIATAVGVGSTWVVAESREYVDEYSYNSYYYEIQITVRPNEGIAFNNSKVTLGPGSIDYISILRAENVGWSEVTWDSSDWNVVDFNWCNEREAELHYVGTGKATVTATDEYGNVASCEVECIGNIEELTFNTNKINVVPGETFQLEYTIVPENTGQTIRFESGNVDVATVDPETGLVTGVDYGDTYIYAIATNGWSWSVPVQVCEMPESVKFVTTDYVGEIDHYTTLDIEYTPDSSVVCKDIEWTIDNPEIGEIEYYGWLNKYVFVGRNFGTTTFRGVAINGDVLEGTITIDGIKILVDGELSRWNEVTLGTQLNLDIQASSEEIRKNVTFRSNDPEVVTVTEDGIATAVGVGSTWVVAQSEVEVNENEWRYYSYDIEFTVRPAEGIAFNINKVVLTSGDGNYISILRGENVDWSYVTWASSDENVVAITWSNDREAELRYVGPGEATVTATDEYGNVATCEVSCYGIIITPSEVDMFTDSTFQLEAKALPETADIEPIQWYSNDPEFVSVDENGLLTTNDAFGLTYVYAYTWINGYYVKAACEVRVSEFIPVTEITLNETALSAEEGTVVQLEATVNPEDASIQALRWESSNEAVATVDENGLVTILSVGDAVITVYATDGSGVSATCTIFGTSGVESLLNDEATFDIYDMNGILVKKDATAEEYKQLDRGIYLIKKGDKVIKVKH